MDREKFWERLKDEIRKEVNDRDFISFFQGVELIDLDDKSMTIEFPNRFVKEWIINNRPDTFSHCACRVAGRSLNLKSRISKKKKPQVRQNVPTGGNGSAAAFFGDNLKPEFTFENFVVGSPNQFSHAAAKAVAEQPGKSYNPLFIYSVPGLGKTHLLNAIGNYIKAHQPDCRICYITSEDFTNEMVDALMGKKMTEFRNKYRQVDILLIDDIQFIAGKESTEEEFFHTFNTLEKNQKQIVMTSDQLPNDIHNLESRLRSRFQMGLIADIQPPDKETLVAIMITKAKEENIPLEKDVAFFLADNLSHLDIRRIIGTLNNIAMQASVAGFTAINIEFARKALEKLNIITWEENTITTEDIIRSVAGHFKISTKDILSRKKTRNIVFPRQIAMYLARSLTDESYPEIGDKFGGKDHATVMHACKKIAREIELNQKTANLIDGLKEAIGS